ncbi:MAG TPA: hypothetical protein VHV49_07235 [Pseudonocardiaceae bacterium]|jgi:hypothetical protein|nr:hypothetical protein [Pseudonocardiaceae bacterium]
MTDPTGADRTATQGSGPYQQAFWFALLLATALLLASGSIAVGAYTADAQPETVVLAYFAALHRGDAAAALGYGPRPPGSTALLTPAILAAQNATGPIQDVAVRHVRRTGDRATVDVTYAVGSVPVADTVPVRRAGRGWRLAHSAVPQDVSAGDGSDLARLAGFAIPNGNYPMFPGAVPVTYRTPNLAPAPGSRVVSFDDGGLVAVDATVSPAGRAAVASAVTAALRSCLAGRSATQHLCPAPHPGVAVPGSLRGRLTGSVARALRYQVRGTDGEIRATGTIPVAASYQRLAVDDVVSTRTTGTIAVTADSYGTQPGTIWWGTA